MTSRIRIFNKWGEYEDAEEAGASARSWVLNGYGRCEFSIAPTQKFYGLRFLQFGNLIHFEHLLRVTEEGNSIEGTGKLIQWAGIIMPPRNWKDELIHVVAYSAEAILAWRAMPFVEVRGTPLAVLQQIIQYVNRDNPNILFKQGIIEDVPVTFQDRLRTNALDAIKKLADFCGMDWWVEANIVPQSYALQLAIYMRKKQTTLSAEGASKIITEGDVEIAKGGDILTEQGTIFNRINAYTQANTAQDRAFVTIDMQESIDLYGRYEINKVYTGVTDPAILADAAALRTASGTGFPQRVFKRIVLDKNYNFSYLRPGNLIIIRETRAGFNRTGGIGFQALVRIISMNYDDGKAEACDMNVEIIQDSIHTWLR